MNSYIRFKLKGTNGRIDMTITPAGCIASIFRRLDVYHSCNVLEQIDQSGHLCNVLLDRQVYPVDRAAGNKNQYYTTTLLSGEVGSLSHSYRPLFAFNGYISFRLSLDSPLAAFVSSGTRAADFKTSTFKELQLKILNHMLYNSLHRTSYASYGSTHVFFTI